MSFTENQILELNRIVDARLRRILEAGLMYTAGCVEVNKINVTSPSSQTSNAPPQQPEIIMHLTDTEQQDGYYIISPKHYLQKEDFEIVNNWVKQQHGEYVKATSNTPGHWRIKA